jgi:hypothetical protein
LQEEGDESISLKMSMQPQEEDKEEQNKEEEDDKIIILGIPMQPQEEHEEEQEEEEWSTYPSLTPNNGNTQIPMSTPSYNINDNPQCDLRFSNLWEDHDDVKEIDDNICLIDDLSLCGDSVHNYFIEFTLDDCKFYERERDKSPLYVFMLFKMQATGHYRYWVPFICCYLFIYKMPMHRKRVRLKS